MGKVDRLGWAEGIAFTSYGTRIGIRASGPITLPELISHIPPHSRLLKREVVDSLFSLIVVPSSDHSRIKRYNLLYYGASRSARSLVLSDVLHHLQSWLRLRIAYSSACGKVARSGYPPPFWRAS